MLAREMDRREGFSISPAMRCLRVKGNAKQLKRPNMARYSAVGNGRIGDQREANCAESGLESKRKVMSSI